MHGIGHSNAVADSGYGLLASPSLSGVGDDRRTAPRNRTHSYSAPQVDYSYGYVESRRRYRPASPGQSRTRVFSDPPRPSHIPQTPGCRTASPHFERHRDSIVVAQERKNRPRGWARIKQRLLRPLSVLKPRRGSEPAQNVATWVHSNYVHVPLHAPMGYPTFEMTPVFGTAAPLGLTDMFGNPGLPHHARRHNR
ncbi:hypothetical protein BV25DRAFT_1920169 [Artomyces pyxidatus]|uniref:Uncharacterized protein n=1 Tax=Artomyces pyxidatus TaxID=48021 RepID=A0ACB8SM58_9AGAM|nr:hypothetical protein BV25DRAFT_1920169 [Artomyces pyxidatus]